MLRVRRGAELVECRSGLRQFCERDVKLPIGGECLGQQHPRLGGVIRPAGLRPGLSRLAEQGHCAGRVAFREAETSGGGRGGGRDCRARVSLGQLGQLGSGGPRPLRITDLEGQRDLCGKQPGPRQRVPWLVGQRGGQ